jgi:hypothetical protein
VLINEKLLNQYLIDLLKNVDKKKLDRVIGSIDIKEICDCLNDYNIGINDFKEFIRGIILRHIFYCHMVSSSMVSTDMFEKNAKHYLSVDAWVLSSRGSTDQDLVNINLLNKCFASGYMLYDMYMDVISRKALDIDLLNRFSAKTQSAVFSTNIDNASPVYKEDGKLRMAFVFRKEWDINTNNLQFLKLSLFNKELIGSSVELINNLKLEALIKRII